MTEKVALITGGATGIGRAISLRLAHAGFATSILYSKSSVEAEETAHSIELLGTRCVTIKADVSNCDDVTNGLRAHAAEFGRLDWLVNNAGITRQLPFSDLDRVSANMWDDLFAVNVRGVFDVCHAAVNLLAQSGDASILNTGSIAGVTGYGSSIPYAVSKAATHGLTKSLAKALAPTIRVNAIAPGAVQTRWWAGHEDKMRMLAGQVLLERVSTPEDIADTAFLVLSAQSMTGQVIVIDNGQSL